MDDNRPLYIISTAADLLGLHPRTLHLYEEKGLIAPTRKGNRRFYSANDLQWVQAIRYLIHERGLNLEGLRRLLALTALQAYQNTPQDLQAPCAHLVERTTPCWQKGAGHDDCPTCPIYLAARQQLCEDEKVPRFAA
ncbi:MAG: MerR family transcriptional regulator [Chloroflexota bacterium]